MADTDQQQKPEPKLRKRSKRKKWLIIGAVVVVVVLLAGATVGTWIYISNLKSTSKSTQQASEQAAASEKARSDNEVNQTVNKAQALVDSGQQAQAIVVYSDAIKAADNSQSKALLLLNEATTYYNDGNYDQALIAAKDSESIEKNSNIEQFIAQIYTAQGDNQNAIKYYQNAITYTDKSQVLAEANISSYENSIKLLGGIGN
jgi:tetratricopeptide (TPR) repeat protein